MSEHPSTEGSDPVAYVTQKMWDDMQGALRAVLRVVDCMPERHHRESLRNIATPRLRSSGGASGRPTLDGHSTDCASMYGSPATGKQYPCNCGTTEPCGDDVSLAALKVAYKALIKNGDNQASPRVMNQINNAIDHLEERAPEPEAKPEPLRIGDPVRLHTVSILCEQHGWTIEALPPTGLYQLRHKKGSLISVQRCDFSLTKPAQQVCPNCDTALPKGCGGIFKEDGASCALNGDGQ